MPETKPRIASEDGWATLLCLSWLPELQGNFLTLQDAQSKDCSREKVRSKEFWQSSALLPTNLKLPAERCSSNMLVDDYSEFIARPKRRPNQKISPKDSSLHNCCYSAKILSDRQPQEGPYFPFQICNVTIKVGNLGMPVEFNPLISPTVHPPGWESLENPIPPSSLVTLLLSPPKVEEPPIRTTTSPGLAEDARNRYRFGMLQLDIDRDDQ
nr:hypothetical protein Iba_chr03bCG9730 [Ipomoea batatas]